MSDKRKKRRVTRLRALPTRRELRRIETWGRHGEMGLAVLGEPAEIVEDAVRVVAERLGVSESTVFHAVRQARRVHALLLFVLDKGIAARWPTTIAIVFLFNELHDGPRRATEIQARARRAGISERALRCVFREFEFRHHRIGGRHGYSIWEMPD